jgi:galactokinase
MTRPLLATWGPGRVNLIGEHTDYSGGLVLPAAIELGITAEITRALPDVALTSRQYGPGESFAADGGGPAVTGWARYGQAVAAELAALGRPAVGFEGEVTSTLPAGAGLSSSAALEVALALALCAVAEFELEPLELVLACQRAELRAVGVPCGILDQAACVLGRPGTALLLDCFTLEVRAVPLPAEAALVVLDSAVERQLEATG